MSEIFIIETVEIKSVSDIFKGFLIGGEHFEKIRFGIFRGENRSDYKLLPTILRENNFNKWLDKTEHISAGNTEKHLTVAEIEILSAFYRLANKNGLYVPNECRFFDYLSSHMDLSHFIRTFTPEKWLPSDLYEVAALAQHYGLPTRLLDWSSAWKTALYFAVIGETKTNHSVLWGLNTIEIHGFSIINSEFPLKLVQPVYRNNENLRAQKGLFTLWEIDKPCYENNYQNAAEAKIGLENAMRTIDKTPLDELIEKELVKNEGLYYKNGTKKPVLYKFLIPKELRMEIFTQLFLDGTNGGTLFPGYNGIKKSVEERFSLDNDYRYHI